MTLSPTVNPSVTGLVYKIGLSTTGNLNVMCASATYFAGKVIAIVDSFIPDDSTGDPNDILYYGYITDANANHQKMLMNTMIWLVTSLIMSAVAFDINHYNFTIAPNPILAKN